MAFENIRFEIPDQSEQFARWAAERGPEWCARLQEYMAVPNRGKVFDWTPDRYYEMVYLWNDLKQTAVEITRYWIGCGRLGLVVNDKAPDGTGNRGVVDGMARRMQRFGILDTRTYPEDRVRHAVTGRVSTVVGRNVAHPKPVNRTREIMAIRRLRMLDAGGFFDSLSREERGLPPAELANVQHPERPEGITYDIAFREEHGRTHIFSAADKRRLGIFGRLTETVSVLSKVSAIPMPGVADFDNLRPHEKDLVQHGINKILPDLKRMLEALELLAKLSVSEPEGDLAVSSETDC